MHIPVLYLYTVEMEVAVANKMKGSVIHTLMHMCYFTGSINSELCIKSIIVDRRRVGGRLRTQ